jgi:CRISPR-associated protein Cmr3
MIGIDAPSLADLADQEILQLGGEQRICSYRKIDEQLLPENRNGDLIMALSPMPDAALLEEFFENAWAGGKLLRAGGWDMQKNFHKDMVTYYPAGTVFQVPENVVLPSGFIRL